MYSEGIANKFSWYTVSLLDIYMNVSPIPVVVGRYYLEAIPGQVTWIFQLEMHDIFATGGYAPTINHEFYHGYRTYSYSSMMFIQE